MRIDYDDVGNDDFIESLMSLTQSIPNIFM